MYPIIIKLENSTPRITHTFSLFPCIKLILEEYAKDKELSNFESLAETFVNLSFENNLIVIQKVKKRFVIRSKYETYKKFFEYNTPTIEIEKFINKITSSVDKLNKHVSVKQ